ncbi:MAG: PhzF family phenazine biosynthesis protein [Burkholderiaceae bacterium]|nr:MAG: PhzF family phenazine biosynthesis protein [Burkholderiaceae bacterium]
MPSSSFIRRAFKQVDVFSLEPYQGNPVAVVMQAEGLSSQAMQHIATWTKMSETTFVLPPTDPQADYLVRIFTPQKELPFAGHPTLGTAHALLEDGDIEMHDGILVQQCAAGLINLDVEYIDTDFSLYFSLPKAAASSVNQETRLALMQALGDIEIGAAWQINVGPTWITLQLENADVVRNLHVDLAAIKKISAKARITGVTVFGELPPGSDAAFEVRSFSPITGVPENHVSASSNGCVAWVVQKDGLVSGNAYTAHQGGCAGHDGQVNVIYEPDGRILIGGHSVTCVSGTILA